MKEENFLQHKALITGAGISEANSTSFSSNTLVTELVTSEILFHQPYSS